MIDDYGNLRTDDKLSIILEHNLTEILNTYIQDFQKQSAAFSLTVKNSIESEMKLNNICPK